MEKAKQRPKPFLVPEYCKGCGRCIEACAKGCIEMGKTINPMTGLIPVAFNRDECNGCALCVAACPEPYGLRLSDELEVADPAKIFGPKENNLPTAKDIPATDLPLANSRPLVIKGNYASAIGAILAGCRHVYGYPITPSTEGAELMSYLQPELGGVFYQAVSEVATVNMMYGTGGAGLPCMTFTSSPGFSLMLEGISYMISAEVPAVFVNVMRGGPGLGNIGPEQADIKLACHGLGHGNTHAITLAPATPQEMLETTILAFELAFKYRNPVIVLGDGYLGQMTGKVRLPKMMRKPGIPTWCVYGDHDHRANLITSIDLEETDLEKRNELLNKKYAQMKQNEQRVEQFQCKDAEYLVIGCNTPAQMAMSAVLALRKEGVKAGLFRPITVWPFPIDDLLKLLPQTKAIIMVEASPGQLEDEMRLALSHANVQKMPRIEHVQHMGGVLPQQNEIIEKVKAVATEKKSKCCCGEANC